MHPKVTLHKRNGHRCPPGWKGTSPGELIRLVHSAPDRAAKPTFDVVKFTSIVGSETRRAFADQVAREIDAIKPALLEVIAGTEAAFDRGELSDVRALLDARREEVEAAARMVARLLAGAGAPSRRPAARRRLLNVNELAAETLYLLVPHLGGGLTVVTRLDPALPRVVGNANDLEQALGALMTCAARSVTDAGRTGTVVVETSHREAAVQGEWIVSVKIEANGSGVAEGLDLRAVSRIAAEHGGVVQAANAAGGGVRFTLELPAI